jgi:nucleosome binding factor SPN SPT16 subunit
LKNFDLVFVWKGSFIAPPLSTRTSALSPIACLTHAFDPCALLLFSDFKKLPMRIEAIPVKSFEPIKHWLNSCDIVFYESSQNILWKTVMKVR